MEKPENEIQSFRATAYNLGLKFENRFFRVDQVFLIQSSEPQLLIVQG
jgi:hypothetical protein